MERVLKEHHDQPHHLQSKQVQQGTGYQVTP